MLMLLGGGCGLNSKISESGLPVSLRARSRGRHDHKRRLASRGNGGHARGRFAPRHDRRVMALDGKSGRYWDYIGVPYPEGRTAPDEGYFFDKHMIDRLHQLGFLDDKGTAFQMFLEANTAPFERMRSKGVTENGKE